MRHTCNIARRHSTAGVRSPSGALGLAMIRGGPDAGLGDADRARESAGLRIRSATISSHVGWLSDDRALRNAVSSAQGSWYPHACRSTAGCWALLADLWWTFPVGVPSISASGASSMGAWTACPPSMRSATASRMERHAGVVLPEHARTDDESICIIQCKRALCQGQIGSRLCPPAPSPVAAPSMTYSPLPPNGPFTAVSMVGGLWPVGNHGDLPLPCLNAHGSKGPVLGVLFRYLLSSNLALS